MKRLSQELYRAKLGCRLWDPVNTDQAGRVREQVCRNCRGERLDHVARAVRAALGTRVVGLCYAASEAVFHLAGGRRAGLVPVVLRTEGDRPVGSHWWLEDRRVSPPRVIDVTAGQFRPRLTRAERQLGRGCGFLTRRPSRAAREIMEAARDELTPWWVRRGRGTS